MDINDVGVRIKSAHEDEIKLIFKFPTNLIHRLVDYGGLDVITHSNPNDLVSVVAGYKGSFAFQLVPDGKVVEIAIKIVSGGPDDKFLAAALNRTKRNFTAFPFIDCEYVKKKRVEGKVVTKVFKFKDGVMNNPEYFGSDGAAGSDTSFVRYRFFFVDTQNIEFPENTFDTEIENKIFEELHPLSNMS